MNVHDLQTSPMSVGEDVCVCNVFFKYRIMCKCKFIEISQNITSVITWEINDSYLFNQFMFI